MWTDFSIQVSSVSWTITIFFFLTHGFILPVLLWRLPFSRNITCHGQSLLSLCTDRSYNGGIAAIGCMCCALLIVSPVFGPWDYVQSSWQTELCRTFYVCISAHLCWPWPGVTWKWAPGVGDFLFSSGSPATTLCTCWLCLVYRCDACTAGNTVGPY